MEEARRKEEQEMLEIDEARRVRRELKQLEIEKK